MAYCIDKTIAWKKLFLAVLAFNGIPLTIDPQAYMGSFSGITAHGTDKNIAIRLLCDWLAGKL